MGRDHRGGWFPFFPSSFFTLIFFSVKWKFVPLVDESLGSSFFFLPDPRSCRSFIWENCRIGHAEPSQKAGEEIFGGVKRPSLRHPLFQDQRQHTTTHLRIFSYGTHPDRSQAEEERERERF